jgi:hypothetical protein
MKIPSNNQGAIKFGGHIENAIIHFSPRTRCGGTTQESQLLGGQGKRTTIQAGVCGEIPVSKK